MNPKTLKLISLILASACIALVLVGAILFQSFVNYYYGGYYIVNWGYFIGAMIFPIWVIVYCAVNDQSRENMAKNQTAVIICYIVWAIGIADSLYYLY